MSEPHHFIITIDPDLEGETEVEIELIPPADPLPPTPAEPSSAG